MAGERRDLNLFRVFASVMEHRNLTIVGRELGLTASAISHALNRLRSLMGDELFLAGRRPTQPMQPTPRALELAPRIASALAELNDVLASQAFDPATCQRVINIGASDYSNACLLPPLVGAVLKKAPGMRVRVMPIGRVDLVEQLDVGRLDVVVSWFGKTPPRIQRHFLMEDTEAVLVRNGHPLTVGKPSLRQLLSFPHLVVEFTGTEEHLTEGFFEERQFNRRSWQDRLLLDNTPPEQLQAVTTVTIPTFAPVPFMLRDTDLVATMPLRLALLLKDCGDLAILELPYVPKTFPMEAAVHNRSERDKALLWLIAELRGALGS